MALFEKMIPFILFNEEGLTDAQLRLQDEQMFLAARAKGPHFNRNDRGGWTSCGVTLGTYTAYRKKKGCASTAVSDLSRMSFSEWREILKGMFWDKWRADEIRSEMTAVALVDWMWVSGKYGITVPQRTLGVKADGIVGPKTLAAINSRADQKAVFESIQKARNEYHASIAKPGTRNAVFLDGWNNRVSRIQWKGFNFKAKAK